MRTVMEIDLDGGALCLDFINTVYSRKVQEVHEYLRDYTEFLKWCKRLGLLDEAASNHLHEMAEARPVKAEEALKEVLKVRENLYQLFLCIATGREQENSTVNEFNINLSHALAHLQMKFDKDGCHAIIRPDEKSLTSPLAHILKSAFDVLVDEPPGRIKECGNCGWLFLDKTKNNKRQWCNPAYCGTVTRSRRYQERKRNSAESIK